MDHPDFPALLETGLSVIRGPVMTIPVSGREEAGIEGEWWFVRATALRDAQHAASWV